MSYSQLQKTKLLTTQPVPQQTQTQVNLLRLENDQKVYYLCLFYISSYIIYVSSVYGLFRDQQRKIVDTNITYFQELSLFYYIFFI
jgi:hypothetical protein